MGVVFQSRPGNAARANFNVPLKRRYGSPPAPTALARCSTVPRAATQTINLLDFGDLFGERHNNWDMTLRKNVRFAGKRLNFGVDVYNVLNSDAATAYNQTYTATLNADGTWKADNTGNPATGGSERLGEHHAARQPAVHAATMSLNF